MYCLKCGTQNFNEERFCKNCGVLLENTQSQSKTVDKQINPALQEFQQSTYNQSNINNVLEPKYLDQAVNPNMKKWAMLSIIIPIVGIIWYCFIGLSFYLALIIAAAGFTFADKGKMANIKMAIIGKVLNGMLLCMAILIFILNLIGIFVD